MSLGGSPYEKLRDDRTKVNNCVGFGTESKKDFPRCPSCLEQWRLEIVNSDDGTKRMGKCIRGCGQLFDLTTMQNEETGDNMLVPSKYTSRFGSTQKQNSMIISQGSDKSKKRKQTGSVNDSLSEDDISDLRKSGINVS